MHSLADLEAANPFWFSEYLLMPKPTGAKASNLKELLHYLREMGEPGLEYHLWQSHLTLTQTVEYPNDFALWAANALHDDKLAEKLSSVVPFEYADLILVREALVELLEDYLWESAHNRQVSPGFEFHFCEASAVILRSGICARSLRQFCEALQTVGVDSIYYHFVEARRRLANGRRDDFSHWIDTNFEMPELVSALRGIDVYFYSLKEIRQELLSLVAEYTGDACEPVE
jgi:hypothetical protein